MYFQFQFVFQILFYTVHEQIVIFDV